jgi:hypothetical protein
MRALHAKMLSAYKHTAALFDFNDMQLCHTISENSSEHTTTAISSEKSVSPVYETIDMQNDKNMKAKKASDTSSKHTALAIQGNEQ